jgi:AGZA family xanthine/uracil permease-like MFS transporter
MFDLSARQTTIAREVRGAVATFLTMAYILFANPTILAAAGVPFEGAAAATAAAAGLCCLLMGLGANAPIALAPGMGLNAVVAFQLASAAGSWQAAMGLIVVEGLVVLALVLLGVREGVMDAIPLDLRRAIGAGIGLFIAFIGAVNAKLVIVPPGTVATLATRPGSVLPPVTFGSLHTPEPLIALTGLIVTAIWVARRGKGALLLGVGVATIAALAAGVAHVPAAPWFRLPVFETVFKADVGAALTFSAVPLIVSLVMVDFFDTIGTVTAIGEAAHLNDPQGRFPRLRAVLAIDAISASIGGVFGASSVTSYVESAAGASEGARTGLHTTIVGVLFLIAMFAAPLAAIVPAAATAPALITVGFLMTQQVTRIDFGHFDTALPAFLTLLLIPLTWSIAHGIGYGFLAHVAIKLLTGRGRDVHPLLYATTAAFAAYFAIE